jgi:hypothetical protein
LEWHCHVNNERQYQEYDEVKKSKKKKILVTTSNCLFEVIVFKMDLSESGNVKMNSMMLEKLDIEEHSSSQFRDWLQRWTDFSHVSGLKEQV